MDQSSFRALFETHAGFVWRVLQRHGVPSRELEDGCQEVFLVLHRRHLEIEDGCQARTFLYGVAVRIAVGMRRRAYHRRELLVDFLPEAGSNNAQPFEALRSRELHQQLMAALASLPRVRREIFVLYELEQMPLADAAIALDVPESTALSRLYAAREAIAAHVRKRERTLESQRRRRVEVA
jgi:RNA polymerase sigma-70 factor (ECF subfamily)